MTSHSSSAMSASTVPRRGCARLASSWTRTSRSSGNIYYSQWRSPAIKSASSSNLVRTTPRQLRRVASSAALPPPRSGVRTRRPATVAKQGAGGTGYFYQAAKAALAMRSTASSQKSSVPSGSRSASAGASQFFSDGPDRLTRLSELDRRPRRSRRDLPGRGGRAGAPAIRGCAPQESRRETERAEGLEEAVAERTNELREANQALKAEARNARPPRLSSARSRRWKPWASSPAASHTISTTCWLSSWAASILPCAGSTARGAKS